MKLVVKDWEGNTQTGEEYIVNGDGELCRVYWTRNLMSLCPVSHKEGLIYYWEEYPLLKRYEEYKDDDFKESYFTKFKIVVASEEDKVQVQEAFRYIHDQHIDTDYVTVNQLVHVYEGLGPNNVVVDPTQFE